MTWFVPITFEVETDEAEDQEEALEIIRKVLENQPYLWSAEEPYLG